MEKVITISNKNYSMKSSALTQFSYKDFTGRSFLKDLQSLIKLKDKKSDSLDMEELDNVTELLLQVTYILVKEADEKQIVDYNSFLKEIDSLYEDNKWIYEVLELACTPISGRLQKNQ